MIALGRKLFFDRSLSVNGTMSCGMCHVPEQSFTSNELATPLGVEGRSLRRNAPTLLNVAYATALFHDGRDVYLETQALMPLIDRVEMANPSLGHLIARLREAPDYASAFEASFGGPVSAHTLGQALAAYERTLLSGNSPFDRWRYGNEPEAMRPEAVRGFALFAGKAGCANCHLMGEWHALFTDYDFHNTGTGELRRRAGDAPVSIALAPGLTVNLARLVVRSVTPRMTVVWRSPAGRRICTGSRPLACATWPSAPPTCTTARWRASIRSCATMTATAPVRPDKTLGSGRSTCLEEKSAIL
jgi:cytochrome c peroxidase